jgi:signal transduction histidine kinase
MALLFAIIVLMAPKYTNIIHLEGREAGLYCERLEEISHDFRTPLNVIIGFSELLLDESPGKINDEQRLALKDILNGGYRLLNLVNEIFTPSSPDAKNKLNT